MSNTTDQKTARAKTLSISQFADVFKRFRNGESIDELADDANADPVALSLVRRKKGVMKIGQRMY